ncbi:NAD(P)/FAD-dependent oxidoreductase [Nocardioides rotundus]|uniref:NAD(P)/FAD-dependent oxidoreductase n=1 Tax=Nocardioides rotundus TaxID=1774216 RepID=UPI001CBCF26D|nr:FAD-dependent oxidoreductase [Nocardioides rotundus]
MLSERAARAALAGARPKTLWLDDPSAPEPEPPLTGEAEADLVVVGGGYAGLWAALRSLDRYPGESVLLVDAGRCGDQASGRNGGFASASLTHGRANGLARWPEELDLLDRLGAANLAAMEADVRRHRIDCGWEDTGELTVATRPHEAEALADVHADLTAAGEPVELLDAAATRARVDSPTYLAGLFSATGTAMVEPARLAWGLRAACLRGGVRIHEHTPALDLERSGDRVEVRTEQGRIRARRVVLATNAFPPLLRRLRLATVPVYDHVLATEPLSSEQRAAVGWAGREGVSDAGNLFHYYRLTHDDRIVWGGYDAVYHYASRIDPVLEQHGGTHLRLAEHFLETFPQLEGIAFSHRWGGVIDTSTRFTAFHGTGLAGRVAWSLGFTGLGVAATRFAADVVLDLLHGEDTERTRLRMVRERPLPFPPEPLRAAGINLTRRELERSDRNGGRRSLWLRALDRAGLGFDS